MNDEDYRHSSRNLIYNRKSIENKRSMLQCEMEFFCLKLVNRFTKVRAQNLGQGMSFLMHLAMPMKKIDQTKVLPRI